MHLRDDLPYHSFSVCVWYAKLIFIKATFMQTRKWVNRTHAEYSVETRVAIQNKPG